MAEQLFVGVGKPTREVRIPEKSTLKSWAKEKARIGFTFAGAEEQWRKTHEKEIAEMTAINVSLSDEDRAKAMEKMEQSIKTAARLRVVGNYTALIAVTGAVVGEAWLIGDKNLAEKVAKNKYFGFVGKQAQGARQALERLGRRKNVEFTPFGLLTDIYNEFHFDELDTLNTDHPFDTIVGDKKFSIGRLNSEIGKMESETLMKTFVSRAREKKTWQPLIVDVKADKVIGYKRSGMDGDLEGMDILLEKGFVSRQDIKNGLIAFLPTPKFIDFVKRALSQ